MPRLKFKDFPQDLASLSNLAIELGNDKPLRRILLLARELGCQTIVSQKPVEHAGFKSEWEDYYKYGQPPLTNKVEKLNFFRSLLHSTSDLENTDSSDFLGYIILRPIPRQRVCESVMHISPASGHTYTLAKGKYTSYVGRRKFDVEGTLFVQQDGNAGVCAHACLVMLSDITSRIFPSSSLQAWSISQIKRCISQMSPPAMGPGLQLPHIARVFEEMGFSNDTLYIFPRDRTQLFTPEQIIYLYAESKIPVFVGLPLEARHTAHSVLVIGHTFDKNAWWPEAWPSYYTTIPSGESWLSSVAWVDNWLICDDNFGPYLSMPKHLCDVSWVAVPLPKNILIKGELAMINAFWIIQTQIFRQLMAEAYRKGHSSWTDPFMTHLVEGKLVLRVFLITKEEFQESIKSDETINKELAQYYLSYSLPDYIWFGELTIPELFREGLRLGEVLINAHCPPNFMRTGHEALLTVHAPGALLTYARGRVTPKSYLVPNDCPSKILTR